jgi:hypothetical protein
MSVQVELPINNDDGALFFRVRYRRVGTLDWQILTPNPIESPIMFYGLLDNTSYEIEAVRVCGISGTNTVYEAQPAYITVDTTLP